MILTNDGDNVGLTMNGKVQKLASRCFHPIVSACILF